MTSQASIIPVNSGLPEFEDRDNQETKYTTCYMCACRCGIKVTVEDNKVRFIQGNPNHPVNKGVLCAKGNSGIMKQYSPAKLSSPLLRKPGTERGAGEFEEISWERALDILEKRLAHIRATDPKQLAYFTGRDQMQALTGMWASQFGTINWAAHGGFCSVNMAAGGLYTMGHAFWEFGVACAGDVLYSGDVQRRGDGTAGTAGGEYCHRCRGRPCGVCPDGCTGDIKLLPDSYSPGERSDHGAGRIPRAGLWDARYSDGDSYGDDNGFRYRLPNALGLGSGWSCCRTA